MGLLDGRDSAIQNTFGGADQLSDIESVQPPNCIAIQNCEFVGPAQVRPRRGFSVLYSLNKALGTIWSWFQEMYNRLLYLDVTNPSSPAVWSIDLVANTTIEVVSSGLGSAAGMFNAAVGFREIMAFYDKTGLATSQGRVWDGTYNSGTGMPNVEALFPRTLLTTEVTFTFSEPSASSPGLDAGSHTFAIAITTWNGAQAPPGPWNGAGILSPQSFTSSGGKNLNIELSPASTWPAWVNQIQIMMTPNDNPNNWYLVPGTITTVPRGSSLPVNITFSISDNTLEAEGLNVTVSGTTPSLFSLYSQSSTGTGPFNPHCVVAFGTRMVYLSRLPSPDGISSQGAIFVSEPQKPQFITLAFHLLNLPEFLDTVTAAVLNAVLYIFGPDWTFGFSDNTQYPVEWAPCITVSRFIGSPFIKGVLANTARQILWVAAKQGLFAFSGGSYTVLPASYEQGAGDWNQINFAQAQTTAANALEIVDYPDQRLVIVKAPIGVGQTVANYMLVWDYSMGYDFETIRYCGKWWINTANQGQLPIGAIALVHSNNQFEELWVASGSATITGKIYRQKYIPIDASQAASGPLYNDDSQGIDARYRTASPLATGGSSATGQPPTMGMDEALYQWIGATIRITGAGAISITAYGADQQNPVPLRTLFPTLTPGTPYFVAADLQGHSIHYEISNQAVAGAYFYLTLIHHWYSQWLEQGDS
jgi:hypothetical protein